jgi:predicted restriction endonuclease
MTNNIINNIKSIDKNNIIELTNLYNELIKQNDKDYLDYLFYSLKKYEYINPNETYEDKIKRKDKKFKESVTKYYKSCIITGRSMFVCEVAHIYPFADSEIEDKYNPFNGIVLCRDMHKLFDDKLIKIDPIDFKLTLSPEILLDNSLEIYHKYNNKILDINPESKHYFEKLYK